MRCEGGHELASLIRRWTLAPVVVRLQAALEGDITERDAVGEGQRSASSDNGPTRAEAASGEEFRFEGGRWSDRCRLSSISPLLIASEISRRYPAFRCEKPSPRQIGRIEL